MKARVRRQLRVMAVVVPLSAFVLGPGFNLVTDRVSIGSATQGAIDAGLIALVASSYVLFVRDGVLRARFQQMSFAANLVVNGAVLLALFLVMRGLGQVLTTGDPGALVSSFGDAHLLWATPFFAVVAFALQFVLQMNRMIGTNVLGYFIAGVYHRPVEEERIFLFLDLESSTHLAERLGSARYYELLRRFVDELSDPILESEGEIYQYAGDEVVITWRREDGVRGANCALCAFRIEDAIARRAEAYEADFGVVPAFRGGLHGGTVVAGELGDLRREIVFVGDILNTAARLEDYAREHGRRLVISGDLLASLELPTNVVAESLGEFVPRGKESGVAVHALSRR